MTVRPTSAWMELLRLDPSVQSFEDRDGNAGLMTRRYVEEQVDVAAAMGLERLLLPYTSYFGRDFFARTAPFFDGDVGAATVWWADGLGPGVEDFDPIAAILARCERHGMKTVLGVNRAGDSWLTLDLYGLHQTFQPPAIMTLSATTGVVTASFNFGSILAPWVGLEIRGRAGGLGTITGWTDASTIELTVTEAFPGATVQPYQWAVTQPDPMRGGLSVADRTAAHLDACRADAARLFELHGSSPAFDGFYVSVEPSGIWSFCDYFLTPLLGDSSAGGPGLASYGCDVWVAPAFSSDIPYVDWQVARQDVATSLAASAAEMTTGKLRIHPQDAIGPGFDYTTFTYTYDPLSVVEQRRVYYRGWRDTVRLADDAALVLGSTQEVWRMDGPNYTDAYPNDFEAPRRSLAIVSDYVSEVSLYAGFGFWDSGDKSLRPVQRSFGRRDYRTRAVRLYHALRDLNLWETGDHAASRAAVFVRIEPQGEDADIVRLWSGAGDFALPGDALDPDGGLYLGVGTLTNLPEIQSLINGSAERAEFTLSGVDATMAELFDGEADLIEGARLNLGILALGRDWQPVTPMNWLWEAEVDAATAGEDGGRMTISLSAGTAMTDRRRLQALYYTGPDQRRRSADDAFCDRVALYTQETTARWPA